MATSAGMNQEIDIDGDEPGVTVPAQVMPDLGGADDTGAVVEDPDGKVWRLRSPPSLTGTEFFSAAGRVRSQGCCPRIVSGVHRRGTVVGGDDAVRGESAEGGGKGAVPKGLSWHLSAAIQQRQYSDQLFREVENGIVFQGNPAYHGNIFLPFHRKIIHLLQNEEKIDM